MCRRAKRGIVEAFDYLQDLTSPIKPALCSTPLYVMKKIWKWIFYSHQEDLAFDLQKRPRRSRPNDMYGFDSLPNDNFKH